MSAKIGHFGETLHFVPEQHWDFAFWGPGKSWQTVLSLYEAYWFSI